MLHDYVIIYNHHKYYTLSVIPTVNTMVVTAVGTHVAWLTWQQLSNISQMTQDNTLIHSITHIMRCIITSHLSTTTPGHIVFLLV